MIKGVGFDTTILSRFNKLVKDDRFINRILTVNEKNDFSLIAEEKKANFLAKRFSGKEAFAKAVGTGIGEFVAFHDVEIIKNSYNAPLIKTLNKNFEFSFYNAFISFSDEVINEDTLISSVVILENIA
jgi:holo-[acyl-carrier protein] synthase